MKIISDFKDYYDTIAFSDGDRDTKLMRMSDKTPHKDRPLCPFSLNDDLIAVGFVNQVYFGVHHVTTSYDERGLLHQTDEYIWNKDKIIKHYESNKIRRYVGGSFRSNIQSYQWLIDRYQHDPSLFAKFGPLWIANPIGYKYSQPEIEINPRLNQYDFAKAVPPFEAYNKLRLWAMNFAGPGIEIPEVSDEMMAEIKGFSAKTSFRRDKGQGPKRKRK